MSANVHILPTESAVDAAPDLRLDRDHMEKTILAYQAFRDLFLASGRKS